jgi:hypothetical protein
MGLLVASRASRLWLALIADKPADQVRREAGGVNAPATLGRRLALRLGGFDEGAVVAFASEPLSNFCSVGVAAPLPSEPLPFLPCDGEG